MITFHLAVTRGDTGRWTITSPELTELHVVGVSFEEAIEAVPISVVDIWHAMRDAKTGENDNARRALYRRLFD